MIAYNKTRITTVEVFRFMAKRNAFETRLNNLILLNEKRIKQRRHSSFFVGLSRIYWAINDDFH